jgi:hypothetical protein
LRNRPNYLVTRDARCGSADILRHFLRHRSAAANGNTHFDGPGSVNSADRDTCPSYGMVTVIKQHRQYGRHASLLPEIHLLGELCYRTRIVFTKTNLLASDANYPGGSFTRSNPTNNDGPEGEPCRIPQPTPHHQNLTQERKHPKQMKLIKYRAFK